MSTESFERDVVAGHEAAHLVIGSLCSGAKVHLKLSCAGEKWTGTGCLEAGTGQAGIARVAAALAGYAYEHESGFDGAPSSPDACPVTADIQSAKLATADLAAVGEQADYLDEGWAYAIQAIDQHAALIVYVRDRLIELMVDSDNFEIADDQVQVWLSEVE